MSAGGIAKAQETVVARVGNIDVVGRVAPIYDDARRVINGIVPNAPGRDVSPARLAEELEHADLPTVEIEPLEQPVEPGLGAGRVRNLPTLCRQVRCVREGKPPGCGPQVSRGLGQEVGGARRPMEDNLLAIRGDGERRRLFRRRRQYGQAAQYTSSSKPPPQAPTQEVGT